MLLRGSFTALNVYSMISVGYVQHYQRCAGERASMVRSGLRNQAFVGRREIGRVLVNSSTLHILGGVGGSKSL